MKFVTHAGEVDFINVKGVRKPHGINLIKAHRILKNSINSQEYLLVSNSIDIEPNSAPVNWSSGSDNYDFGSFEYDFIDLDYLISSLEDAVNEESEENSVRDITISTEVDVSPKILFEIITNLSYRQYWTEGINELKYDHDKVNREGKKHICILDNGKVNVTTIASDNTDDSLVLGEKTLDPPIADSLTTYYIVKPTEDENRSILIFETSISGKGIIYTIFKPLLRSKMKKILNTTIKKLREVAPGLVTTIEQNH